MTWLGNLSTWGLLAVAWVGCSIVVAILFGVMARVGGGEERGE